MSELSFSELAGWYVHFSKHGFLQDVQKFMLGQVTAAIYNVNKRKSSKPFLPADFYPEGRKKPQQTWQQQLAIVSGMAKKVDK